MKITKRYSIYKNLVLRDERSEKLNFNSDNREHYVYRITDYTRDTEQHYYGSHTPAKNKRYDSLMEEFWTYKTSSKKNILNEKNKGNYKIKILKVFDNAADKIIYEAFLHQYFNVRNNNLFWNCSNQTPFHFQVGDEAIIKRKTTINSKEWKETIGIVQINKMKNKFNNKEWKESIGEEKKRKELKTKSNIEWKETVGSNAIKERNKTMDNEIYFNGKPTSIRKKAGEKTRGNKHYSFKEVIIFNEKSEIMFIINESFKVFCCENKLPVASFKRSKDNKGTLLFQTKRGVSKAIISGMIKYKGWYALNKEDYDGVW